ncbi:acyl-coenzyme A thioesterase PaaI-like protein [Tahibacter aquaticus]|uniref:Acyl-coenzyme A thioesterase PaaI-like protein n=1 Tax=Tahibacter aquaticus TaxID=520092 RepID=A0A4R6Z9R3_9GAMM|nr:hotdog fold domain-containing protein [Tahibacter aquaticus]TDR48605.1 acyl-coenzyme A thioesterase PaaI-like protein [Tahibacter aquaticus]
MASEALRLFRKFGTSAAGRWFYSRLICWRAPYFGSIGPTVELLETGRCIVRIRQRRRVQNHIGTVHAIALCNMAEMAGGLATDATIPASTRWIPKGMSVRYLKKASGRMTATALVPLIADPGQAQDLHARVEVRDDAGDVVFDADIVMWVSPRK